MDTDYRVNIPEGRSGSWAVERFVVPAKLTTAGMRCALAGRPVVPGTYTRLIQKGAWDPIMSDTPAEVRDHLAFIRKAKGRVLVNGLGLGVVIKALLAKPEVEHLDVVEIEADVISLVAPSYMDSRLTIHHADAYTIIWPPGTRWDYVWHDIWPDICTDNLEGIAKLKRKYARMVDWQEAWVEDLLRYNRRRGR